MGNLQLSPGSLFGNRFEIQRAAGSGGMGTVYRATDRYSGETVALKLLHSGRGGFDETERFAREAQLLSELRHACIVAHIAHGQTADGQRFLAMEWLEGEDLGERLLRGPLPIQDCLRLLQQVADGLAVAHQCGIIHRDLKPTNLFLVGGDVGRVKILDFGIARRIATSHAMTRTGLVVGTPEYMAPEQARGSRDLTPAADLFALGCVLYECLTGEPPFVADHVAAVLVRILFEEPAPIEDRRPGIPAAVSAILGRLLAKHPEHRIANAALLRTELLSLGEIPEPALAATVAHPKAKVEGFSEKEQSLFCIVLAAPTEDELGFSPTQPGSAVHLASPDREALLQALAGLGGTPEFLANGTLLVTVPPLGSALDQATVAARAALLIKERWPDAVVSMATGRGTVRGRTAVGEVVELAARSLKSGTHPAAGKPTSGVLIDPLSAKLLEGRFAQTPRPDGALLLHEERDGDATRPLLGKPTPCVGREAELGVLESQLAACIEESETRVVLFAAPPGAGKSRLRHEFIRRVEKRSESVTVLLGRGDMMSAGAPYGILRAALHHLCGISGSERLDTQRERLRARVGLHLAAADSDRIVSFVGELCSVPFPEDGRPMLQAARQDPKIMRDCLRRAFLDFIAAECATAPVLLVLDDLQWGDELTVSMIDEVLREQARASLLILSFARPEIHEVFPRLWQSHKVLEIPLKGLSKKACERLIVQVLGKDIAADAVARAVEQSAGNALFLEELIRSLAEGKPESQPETVVAMLQARIGRLDSNLRRAVRAAAVFGQSFWLDGVAALLGSPATIPEIEGWLSALVDAEILQPHAQSRLPNQSEYSFRHALVRDAGYSLLTDRDLQIGHRLAAEFLTEAGERDPSVLGEHFEKGGNLSRAALAFIRAAELAVGQAGLESTLRYVERGLRCGPSGESLGVLRSLESSAAFWMSAIDRAFTAAMEALPLLRPGSGPYCRALAIGCHCALVGLAKAQAKLSELLPLILSVEPDREGGVHLIEGLSDLATILSASSPYAQLQLVLSRLEILVAKAAAHDPLFKRWLSLGKAHSLHHHRPIPWTILQDSLHGIELADRAGDRRTRLKLELFGRDLVMAELGDPQTPERMRATLRGDLVRHELMMGLLNQLLLGLFLSLDSEAAAQEEALRCAKEAISIGFETPFVQGVGHLVSAQVKLQRNMDADADARTALRLLEPIALWIPSAQATLIRALLAQSRTAEAVEVAEQGLGLLQRFGGVGFLEVELRLAISEAFHTAGNLARGKTELRETLQQIQLRADDITDPFWKNSYLTRNPYCARAQKLGQEWALDVVVA